MKIKPFSKNTAITLLGSVLLACAVETSHADSTIYQGLANTSLGGATLAVTSSDEVISNLGSSGQDGLSIALPGNLTGLNVEWQNLDVSNALPVGSYLEGQVVGTAAGINGELGETTVTKIGTSNYMVSANFSPIEASSYTLQAYHQGSLMGQWTNQPGPNLGIVNGGGGGGADITVTRVGGYPVTVYVFPYGTVTFWVGWTLSVQVSLGASNDSFSPGTGQGVLCDNIVIIPQNVTSNTPTALQITASQIPAIAITSENESVAYQGLINTTLGNAVVAATSSDEVISNLGSGGQDGLSIAFQNDAASLDVEWQNLDVSNALPVGSYLEGQVVGMAGGITNGELGEATVTKAGTSNYMVSANFSPIGASGYTVQAYHQGSLVGQWTNQPGPNLGIVNGGGGGGADISITRVGAYPVSIYVFPYGLVTFWVGGTVSVQVSLGASNDSFSVGTGQGVLCDNIAIIPENGAPNTPTALQITASRIPAIEITSENESVAYQGLIDSALGNATLAVESSDLVISNLTSGGQDGLTVALPANLAGLDIGWQDLDPSNTLPVGAYLQTGIIGTAGQVTNGLLGTSTVTKAGTSDYVVSANFSPLGTSTCVVEAVLDGVIVADVTNQSPSSIASCPIWPISDDIERYETDTGWVENRTWSWDWSLSTVVTLSGGPTVNCDHLFITPQNVSWVSPPMAMQITGSQVPALTITNQILGLVYQGVINTALGSAALNVSSNQLTISNFAGSGQTGVALTEPAGASSVPDGTSTEQTIAGPLVGVEANWDPLDPSNSLPVGAYILSKALGASGVLGALKETKVGTGVYSIAADYSPLGAKTYVAQAYYQGSLMAQTTNQNGATLATANLLPGGKDLGDIITPLSDEWPDGSGALLSFGAGAGVPCDHLIVTPQNVAGTVTDTGFQLLVSQVPIITITNENLTVSYAGLDYTSLGSAALYASSSELDISNLGSGGQDGVGIALPGSSTALDFEYQDLDISNALPVGAYIQMQAVGTASGAANGVLGEATVAKAGISNYLVSANFSSIGSSTYTVEAYYQGTLVAEATGQKNLSTVSCINMPDSMGWGIPPQDAIKVVTWGPFYFDWKAATLAALSGSMVNCDHLVMIPESPTATVSPATIQIVASQVPSVTLTGVNISPFAIHVNSTAQGVVLNWLGTAILQESSNLGTWADVTNATSPYSVATGGSTQAPAKFYRLVFSP